MAAGLNPKKKRGEGKPGTVLIIFLVLFILLSIGLGVTAYYGYAGQEKLRQDAKNAEVKQKAQELLANMLAVMAEDMRLATGVKAARPFVDDATFGPTRAELLNDAGKWKDEPLRAPFIEAAKALKDDLGFNDAANKYVKNYQAEYKRLQKEVDDFKSKLETTRTDLKAAQDKFAELSTRQETLYKTALANIDKGSKAALSASQARSDQMTKQIQRNQDLENLLKEQNDKFEEEKTKLVAQINLHEKTIAKMNAVLADGGGPGGPAGGAAPVSDMPHALVLDISRGKTLWDAALGKITRVENQDRQVYINLGSAHGMKAEVTFNVFAAGDRGKAAKELKGTIEVLRVLDANTSLARITSLYDTFGNEIILTDPTRGRAQRESDNALKEGDLLFNMFWGSRVAIAGNVTFGGQASDSPAEQLRILSSFVNYLERLGVTVDAYVDPTTGMVKGAGITPRTRYLIRGDDVFSKKANGAPKKEMKAEEPKDGEEPKEEMKKEDLPLEGPDAERIKRFSESFSALKKEAIQKGMFIISVDNFLGVAGYRQPRSANFVEASGFRPSVITAGDNIRGLKLEAPMKKNEEPPAPKEEEKKDQ